MGKYRGGIPALAVAATILATAACSGVGGTLRYGTIWEPFLLNPTVAPDVVTKMINELIFDGLVTVNDKMEIVPELAESWTVAEDGLSYTFKLRSGVTFHDGTALTSEDVKFTFESIMNPDQPKTLAKSDYELVSAIEAPDPHTVVFRLKGANIALLSKLAVGIVPKRLLEGAVLAEAPFNKAPVGSGPFSFVSWEPGKEIKLAAYGKYWKGRPRLETVSWLIYSDSVSLTDDIISGEVDGGQLIDPKDQARIDDIEGLAKYVVLDACTYIGFNSSMPPFDDERVRRALNYGVDKQAVISWILGGRGKAATSDILPTSWAYNPKVERFDYSPDRARALLAEAGWAQGEDGVLTKDGARLEFELETNEEDKLRQEVVNFVRDQWARIGAMAIPKFTPYKAFLNEHVLKSAFQAVLLSSSVNVDPDYLSRRWSTQAMKKGHNFLRWSSPELDALLARGILAKVQAERKPIYDRAQEIVAEASPAINLYHREVVYAFKATLKGIKPGSSSFFWNAEEWGY